MEKPRDVNKAFGIYKRLKNDWYWTRRFLLEEFEVLRKRRPNPRAPYPAIIFLSGFPRSGTSLTKNYLGDLPQFTILPFETRGFHVSWKSACANTTGKILIDKNTHYIKTLDRIERACGQYAAIACVIRDPRDVLLSLVDFDGHHGHTREWESHLNGWAQRYERFLQFSEASRAKCYLFRYEDMVRYPLELKTHFAAWAGVQYSDEISRSYSVKHEGDIQDPKVSKAGGEILTDSLSKFLKAEGRLRDAFRNHRHPLMDQFGYLVDGIGEPRPLAQKKLTFFRST